MPLHFMRMTLALSLAAGVSAQSAQTPSSPNSPPNIAAPPGTTPEDASETLTLTGCLERERGSGGEGRLILKSRAGRQQAGAALPGAATTTLGTYYVESEGDHVDLEANVGHRVEIVGRLRTPDGAPDRRSNAGITPSMPSGGSGMETLPRPTDESREKQRGTDVGETTPETAPPISTVLVAKIRSLEATCPQGSY